MAGSAGTYRAPVTAAGMPGELRTAVPADAHVLAALDRLVNPSRWTESQFRVACSGQTDGGERAIVLDDGGQPVGFAVFSRVLDEACIHNIAVHPLRQRSGLGALLLAAVLKLVEKEGAARCFLEVRVSNLPAHRLYAKFGFKPDGIRRNYYSTTEGREDALVMSRSLIEGSTA